VFGKGGNARSFLFGPTLPRIVPSAYQSATGQVSSNNHQISNDRSWRIVLKNSKNELMQKLRETPSKSTCCDPTLFNEPAKTSQQKAG
jgi:hypothetical protein